MFSKIRAHPCLSVVSIALFRLEGSRGEDEFITFLLSLHFLVLLRLSPFVLFVPLCGYPLAAMFNESRVLQLELSLHARREIHRMGHEDQRHILLSIQLRQQLRHRLRRMTVQ